MRKRILEAWGWVFLVFFIAYISIGALDWSDIESLRGSDIHWLGKQLFNYAEVYHGDIRNTSIVLQSTTNTEDGAIQWDSDEEAIYVGTGSGRVSFSPGGVTGPGSSTTNYVPTWADNSGDSLLSGMAVVSSITGSGTTTNLANTKAIKDLVDLGSTLLQDADQDTKITVEASPDEDTIRFNAGGIPDIATVTATGVGISNTDPRWSLEIGTTGISSTLYPYTSVPTASLNGRLVGSLVTNLVDVTIWGAVPNDSVNDSAAINGAIAAANNLEGGDYQGFLLYFPPGEYLVTPGALDPVKTGIYGPGAWLRASSTGSSALLSLDLWNYERGSKVVLRGLIGYEVTHIPDLDITEGHRYGTGLQLGVPDHCRGNYIEIEYIGGFDYGVKMDGSVLDTFCATDPDCEEGGHIASNYMKFGTIAGNNYGIYMYASQAAVQFCRIENNNINVGYMSYNDHHIHMESLSGGTNDCVCNNIIRLGAVEAHTDSVYQDDVGLYLKGSHVKHNTIEIVDFVVTAWTGYGIYTEDATENRIRVGGIGDLSRVSMDAPNILDFITNETGHVNTSSCGTSNWYDGAKTQIRRETYPHGGNNLENIWWSEGDVIYNNFTVDSTTFAWVCTDDSSQPGTWAAVTSASGLNSISQGDSAVTVTDAGTGSIAVTVDSATEMTFSTAGAIMPQGERIYWGPSVGASLGYIEHNGSNMVAATKSGNFVLYNATGGENMLTAAPNGAVSLYYDNGITAATESGGFFINGDLRMLDNEQLRFGTSQDLIIYHDDTYGIEYIKSIGDFRIWSTTYDEPMLACVPNSSCVLYFSGEGRIQTTNNGLSVYGRLDLDGNLRLDETMKVIFDANGSADTSLYFNSSPAEVRLYVDGVSVFDAEADGDLDLKQDLYVGGDTYFSGNNQSADNNHYYFGTSNDMDIYHDGTYDVIASQNGATLLLYNQTNSEVMLGAAPNAQVSLYYNGTEKMRTQTTGIYVYGDVNCSGTCDYVFEPDYDLLALDDLSLYIKEHKHLPNLEAEDYSIQKLVEKTEEQALYILQLHKQIKEMKQDFSNRVAALSREQTELREIVRRLADEQRNK